MYCLEFDFRKALPLITDYDSNVFGTDLDKNYMAED